MGSIEQALKNNRAYARTFRHANLPAPPGKKLAVVACMDARLHVPDMVGMGIGDIHTLRNAGGIVTEDVLRSLLISHYLLGVEEFMVINHTDCGMLSFKDAELRARLEKQTGTDAVTPACFHACDDLEQNVRRQVQKLQSHPWMPRGVRARGFIFDVKTGRLHEVTSRRARQPRDAG
jgi:carbonic anhydrase